VFMKTANASVARPTSYRPPKNAPSVSSTTRSSGEAQPPRGWIARVDREQQHPGRRRNGHESTSYSPSLAKRRQMPVNRPAGHRSRERGKGRRRVRAPLSAGRHLRSCRDRDPPHSTANRTVFMHMSENRRAQYIAVSEQSRTLFQLSEECTTAYAGALRQQGGRRFGSSCSDTGRMFARRVATVPGPKRAESQRGGARQRTRIASTLANQRDA